MTAFTFSPKERIEEIRHRWKTVRYRPDLAADVFFLLDEIARLTPPVEATDAELWHCPQCKAPNLHDQESCHSCNYNRRQGGK